MNILLTLDGNYLMPALVLLKSIAINSPNNNTNIYLIYSDILNSDLEIFQKIANSYDFNFYPIKVDNNLFAKAKISKRYPKTMYYRMLAPLLLDKKMDRILYLDPDILVLNPLDKLYNYDLQDKAFGLCCHSGVIDTTSLVNNIRLNTQDAYFNTGVILMELNKARKIVKSDEIFQCVKQHANELILPDQDIFNMLYGAQTMQLDDLYFNYDARKYNTYMLSSEGLADTDWLMANLVILHFCGKNKPFKKHYVGRFKMLYSHYLSLVRRDLAKID